MLMSDYGLPPGQPGGRGRILIADDDEPLRRMLGAYLEDEGYLVHLAADGQQALEAVPGFLPDLVLLDVEMPKLDGLEVARRLRAACNMAEGNLRILMLSGLGDDVARAAGLRAGADEYLTKPMRPRELLQRIQALLRHAEVSDADPAYVRRL
jgi:DNA-binding response OmpR family regulator